MKPLAPGDLVAVTRDFLESKDSRDRYAWAQRRGTILEITDGWLAVVKWNGERESYSINVGNLCRPHSVAFVESTRRDT